MLGNRIISGRAIAAVIAAELAILTLVAWFYAGMPGIRNDTGPASVSVQFAPPASQALVRTHQI